MLRNAPACFRPNSSHRLCLSARVEQETEAASLQTSAHLSAPSRMSRPAPSQ